MLLQVKSKTGPVDSREVRHHSMFRKTASLVDGGFEESYITVHTLAQFGECRRPVFEVVIDAIGGVFGVDVGAGKVLPNRT